jgi:N4-gp56 family major capsid protein
MGALQAGEELAEGSNGTAGTLTTSAITATLKDFGKYHDFSSHVQLNAPDPVLEELFSRLGQQAAEDADLATRDILAASTNIYRPSTHSADSTITASDVIDKDTITRALAGFDVNNQKPVTQMLDPNGGYLTTPGQAAFIGFAHSDVINDMEKTPATTEFVTVDRYASGNMILPGEVGKTGRVRWISVNGNGTLDADAGDSAVDVYSSIIVAARSYGVVDLAGRPVQSHVALPQQVTTSNPLARAGTIGYTFEHAAAIHQTAGVAVLNTASGFGANT